MSLNYISDKSQKDLYYNGNMDHYIFVSVLILTFVGYIFSKSFETPNHTSRQYLIFNLFGICTMLLISKIDYHKYMELALHLYISALLLSALAIYHISTASGYTSHFLRIGPLYINVVEFLLFAATLEFTKIVSVSKAKLKSFWDYGIYSLVFVILPIFVLSNLSIPSICIYGGIVLVLSYIRKPLWMLQLLLFPIAGGLLLAIVYAINPERFLWMSRMQAWLDPFSAYAGYGYGAVQSIYAASSGGLFGMGVGHGTAAHLLPNPHSNYLLSLITQEIGLFGAFIILLIFSLLFFRGILTALHASDPLGFYLAIAVVVKLLICVFMQIGVVTNLLPETTNYLPFLFGKGAAAFFDFISVGILLNISRFKRTQLTGN